MIAPTEYYVKDLEDEVMELRAKLQVTQNELTFMLEDRDRWLKEATMWSDAYFMVLACLTTQ